MKAKSKKILGVLLLTGGVLLGYSLWLSLRPVEVVAVHQRHHFSDVLVKDFPTTDQGKISWWLKKKEMLKSEYNIPKPASYGNFSITFWDFSKGYKEDEYDRLCFDDMKTDKNCIDKNAVFTVNNDSENRIIFTVYNGKYLLKENGEIVKFEYK
ncbi:DUF943 family protein [Yersinia pekkanenii]|uniref:Membrane protein n=1 Tax=Yersinia pekkanenii TaxID=1288385 RepID=A0A0T9R6D8_9GAMM|nr:DUF943 family protein [Yersinia pekkanenii]CNI45848.1 membrane protein [Yersinia pekkanenii]CRY68841.1 membrane protein [Yersinia pekkanenii]